MIEPEDTKPPFRKFDTDPAFAFLSWTPAQVKAHKEAKASGQQAMKALEQAAKNDPESLKELLRLALSEHAESYLDYLRVEMGETRALLEEIRFQFQAVQEDLAAVEGKIDILTEKVNRSNGKAVKR